MRRTLQEINGKWEWIENPTLDSDMKNIVITERKNVSLSEFDIQDLIKKGASPVNSQIEKFLKEHGL